MAEEPTDATTMILKLVQNTSQSSLNSGTGSHEQDDPMFLASYYMMYKIG